MNIRTLLLVTACALLTIAAGPAADLAAQGTPFAPATAADKRVPVILVYARNGEPATIFRRSSTDARNMILLDPRKVDAQRLSEAVLALLVAEAADPKGRERSDRLAQRVRAGQTHPVYPWAQEALRRLETAAERPITGMGKYRALEIWVAPLQKQNR